MNISRRIQKKLNTRRALWTSARGGALVLSMSLLSCLFVPSLAAAEATFGDGVQLKESTEIAEILADPKAWEGKTVRVEGRVAGVCPKKGCWMSLAAQGKELRIKVEDDVIVFPREIEGAYAVAEGTVKLLDLSREQFEGWKRHEAEERGEDFDPASVGDGPYQIVQIQAVGAAVEAAAP